MDGVNIELRCWQPQPSIPDAFDIYYSILKPSYSLATCNFNGTTNSAVFNTGSPYYAGGQRCSERFSCSNASEIVYFKFYSFQISSNYDYFAIGLPEEYEGKSSNFLRTTKPTDNSFLFENNSAFANSLVLEGLQQTDVWVSTESIQDFRIYFYRIVQFNYVRQLRA